MTEPEVPEEQSEPESPNSTANGQHVPIGHGEAGEPGDGLNGLLARPPVKPWPAPVDGCQLLEEIHGKVSGYVVLPKWAAETLAPWVQHTYGYEYRDVTTYIGIESPEHRCGKSTLISVLSELTHKAIVSSNVTAPSFFRVIARVGPTLFIDEADTFLTGNEELRGILNSSYYRKTAFVLRAVNLPAAESGPAGANGSHNGGGGAGTNDNSGILRFSCWCPKLIARIGALPVTLADRCIVFRLHRKTAEEKCERLRRFDAGDLPAKCLRFALDHAGEIASAEPEIPREMNDRAADIWEPLFVIADLAGGPWPERVRNAAVAMEAGSGDANPMGVLLFDALVQFSMPKTDRMFSSELVERLNGMADRPWKDLRRGKPIDDRWLARRLGAYGVHPRNLRINGVQAKGYYQEELVELVRRYVSKPEARALIEELRPVKGAAPDAAAGNSGADAQPGSSGSTASGPPGT